MTTNLDIITTAFRITNIINENEAPSSELAAEGLEAMNDLLDDWEADGIELGYFPQTNLAGLTPLENKDLRGVKYNLAVELAGRKSVPMIQETKDIARDGKRRLSKGAIEVVENSFSHMPGGRHAHYNINTG